VVGVVIVLAICRTGSTTVTVTGGTMTWGVEVESPVRLLARVVAFWLARTLSTLAW
jgi:hypothetical protein